MCGDCFRHCFFGFRGYQEFRDFETELHQKLDNQQLHLINISESLSIVGEAVYQCQTCQDTWALSSPDNAWRGYFLPLQIAEAYLKKVRRKDFTKGLLGGLFLLVLVVFALWKLLG